MSEVQGSIVPPARWEIINPSDRCEFETDDMLIAAVVVFMLGEGRYGAKEINGDRIVPIFLLGGHDEWCMGTFGTDLKGVMEESKSRLQALGAAFRSVTGTQTSLNDIVGYAHRWADKVEAKTEAQAHV
jgi:hypothetical protein